MHPIRYSPVYAYLAAHALEWGAAGDAELALRLDTAANEAAAVSDLALCDLSGLARFGFRGASASEWLLSAGVPVPSEVFGTASLPGHGIIARLGTEEFLMEEGLNQNLVTDLSRQLGTGLPGVYRIDRHDGTFLLCGRRATKVLAQTCGVNFQETPLGRVVFTRVAAINCMILPQRAGEVPGYRLWTDPSFAVDLWQTLAEIVGELQGRVVGAASVG